ncbi:hypothetical protein VBApiPXC38_91 [Acinetobacter phage VB_ApiP_XC38]|uniref:Uncharacterized protein n=1 Tax=Acinetobacter phage VB_ApiP_XC38 TaxID=2655002 RepID=A0A5P8PR65_9CAUD|nr:hypothetical protein KNU81_gp91 [Acinetobacter phage VB_ApiP_XC38]QFR59778.1 hypothetical protein VBApiPXC38_91 [Acinetobacter phage VB_ApiP_XC38]
MAIVMPRPHIFAPRGTSKTNIHELFDKFAKHTFFSKYPYTEVIMSITKDNLIHVIDNRMAAHGFPKGTGFYSLQDMLNKLNRVADYNADISPDNLIRLAAKIDHLDKVNKDIVYDNINVFMGLMRFTPQHSTNDSVYINTLMKQLFVAQVYFRYCGYTDIKLQPQGKRNLHLHDEVKHLFKLNDKYRGVTR